MELSDREYNRVVDIIDTSRKYHIRNIFVASISVALLFKAQNETLKLFLDIELPVKLLVFISHFIVIGLTTITVDSFLAIWSIVQTDDRIPYNWFIFNKYKSKVIPLFLLVAPYVISIISFFQSELVVDKGAVLAIGVVCIMTPINLRKLEVVFINPPKEQDVTLSMFIYRIYQIVDFVLFFALLFAFFGVSAFKDKVDAKWIYGILSIMVCIRVIRLIWETKFVYTRIDKIGTKIGFKTKKAGNE